MPGTSGGAVRATWRMRRRQLHSCQPCDSARVLPRAVDRDADDRHALGPRAQRPVLEPPVPRCGPRGRGRCGGPGATAPPAARRRRRPRPAGRRRWRAVSGLPLPFRFHETSVVGTAGPYPGRGCARPGRVPPAPAYDRRGARHDQRTLRRDLVRRLRDAGHLRDDRVAAAFAAVPRELFLADARRAPRRSTTCTATTPSSPGATRRRAAHVVVVAAGDHGADARDAGRRPRRPRARDRGRHRLQRRAARPPGGRRRGRHVGRARRRRGRRRPAGAAGGPVAGAGRGGGRGRGVAGRPPPSTRSSPPPASTASPAPGSTSFARAGAWWCRCASAPSCRGCRRWRRSARCGRGSTPVAVTGGRVHAPAPSPTTRGRPGPRRPGWRWARWPTAVHGRSHVELTGPRPRRPRPRRPPAAGDDRARLRPPAARCRSAAAAPLGLLAYVALALPEERLVEVERSRRPGRRPRGARRRRRGRRQPGRAGARAERADAARRLRGQPAPSGACCRRSSGGSWPGGRRSPTPASPCATARCARTAGAAPAAATSGSPSTGPRAAAIAVVRPSGVSRRDRVVGDAGTGRLPYAARPWTSPPSSSSWSTPTASGTGRGACPPPWPG